MGNRLSVNAKNAIGIFGGTFDPIHFGHLRAAIEAQEKLGLDDMRLLPAGTPPHRSGTYASPEHRIAMLRLALGENSRLSIDDRELNRPGSSFMVDTLSNLRTEYPSVPLVLLIGQDAANSLDKWHEWRSLFELAHLVIMRRPESVTRYSEDLGSQLKSRTAQGPADLCRTLAGIVLPVEVTQLAISSTDIRSRIMQGKTPRFLLPDAVISYIRKENLYSEK